MKHFPSAYPFVLAAALFVSAPLSRAHEKDGKPEATPAPAAAPAKAGGEERGQAQGAPSGDAGRKMDHGKMGDAAAQKDAGPAPDAKQLEASRAQLEASRLQLEASRQQLEVSAPKPAEPGHDHAPQPDKARPQMDHAEHQESETMPETGGDKSSSFFKHLNQPEYMHVLVNPMPVYGLSMGVLALAIALLFRSRPTIIVAPILIVVSGLSAWPTYHYGQAAYDRVKEMSDGIGTQWLDEHMARGEKLIYAFYLLAAVALAGIVAPMKWPRSSLPLAIVTLALGVGTLGIGGWISYAGGHVRHQEFRFEPPPAQKQEEHHHGGGESEHGAAPGGQTEGAPKSTGEGHTHQH